MFLKSSPQEGWGLQWFDLTKVVGCELHIASYTRSSPIKYHIRNNRNYSFIGEGLQDSCNYLDQVEAAVGMSKTS